MAHFARVIQRRFGFRPAPKSGRNQPESVAVLIRNGCPE
jgi:hypothetical protein